MNKKNIVILGAIGAVALTLVGISTLLLTQGNQDIRSRADTPDTTTPIIPPTTAPPAANPITTQDTGGGAPLTTQDGTATPTATVTPPTPTTASANNACQTPAAMTGVTVEYPYCEGEECSFVQADCTWNPASGASGYTVVVTEVDTNTVVKNETATPDTTKTVFPVTQGKTYKCDVSAVNACGQVGVASSHQLLCEVDGLVASPTPSLAPTPIATDTPTTVPPTAKPTLPPSGNSEIMTAGIVGGIIIMVLGGLLFIL